ncbi:MAG: DUF7230 family protein [Gammaproteobacteria bacterium]
MAKRKKTPDLQQQAQQNPVAKYMHRFNQARIYDDKKTHYRRRRKHKNAEPFAMPVWQALQTAPV